MFLLLITIFAVGLTVVFSNLAPAVGEVAIALIKYVIAPVLVLIVIALIYTYGL